MVRVFALAVLALLAPLEGGGVMFAAKQILLGRCAKAAWQNPYVTDGLVAMWDGEWNAGGGVHDATATTWTDLSGSRCNLRAPAQYSFGSNFCDLPAGKRFTGTLPSVMSETTTEFVGCFTESYKTSTDCDLGVEVGNRGLGTMFLSNIANLTRDVMVATRTSNASSMTIYRIKGSYPVNAVSAYVNVLTSFSGTAKISSGREFGLYVNGQARTGTSANYWTAPATTPTSAIAVGTTGKTAIRLCCVRIYSRVLTAAEIAANHAIDRARFNTP